MGFVTPDILSGDDVVKRITEANVGVGERFPVDIAEDKQGVVMTQPGKRLNGIGKCRPVAN